MAEGLSEKTTQFQAAKREVSNMLLASPTILALAVRKISMAHITPAPGKIQVDLFCEPTYHLRKDNHIQIGLCLHRISGINGSDTVEITPHMYHEIELGVVDENGVLMVYNPVLEEIESMQDPTLPSDEITARVKREFNGVVGLWNESWNRLERQFKSDLTIDQYTATPALSEGLHPYEANRWN
jgi:hypothetical protein